MSIESKYTCNHQSISLIVVLYSKTTNHDHIVHHIYPRGHAHDAEQLEMEFDPAALVGVDSGHDIHVSLLVAPGTSEYVFAGQSVQLLMSVPSVFSRYVPAGHCENHTLPFPEQ